MISESDVRKLRDNVYDKPISDQEWDKAKSHWMADVQWLIDNQPKRSTANSPAF